MSRRTAKFLHLRKAKVGETADNMTWTFLCVAIAIVAFWIGFDIAQGAVCPS
jgi:hypothetical protein